MVIIYNFSLPTQSNRRPFEGTFFFYSHHIKMLVLLVLLMAVPLITKTRSLIWTFGQCQQTNQLFDTPSSIGHRPQCSKLQQHLHVQNSSKQLLSFHHFSSGPRTIKAKTKSILLVTQPKKWLFLAACTVV